jgi:3-phenylpropionate/trans-cinnamate dioxygenase ferredoxin subunit
MRNTIIVGSVADLPEGGVLRVACEPPIAVFNAGGQLYAIDDTCSHQDASLSDGWLEGCLVECPLHSSTFDLRTGEPTSPPAREPVRVHAVHLQDGMVVLETDAIMRVP